MTLHDATPAETAAAHRMLDEAARRLGRDPVRSRIAREVLAREQAAAAALATFQTADNEDEEDGR